MAVAILFLAFRWGRVSRKLLASMSLLYLLFAGLLVALHLSA